MSIPEKGWKRAGDSCVDPQTIARCDAHCGPNGANCRVWSRRSAWDDLRQGVDLIVRAVEKFFGVTR